MHRLVHVACRPCWRSSSTLTSAVADRSITKARCPYPPLKYACARPCALLRHAVLVVLTRCPVAAVQPCLPVGQSDIPRQRTVKIFCPKCSDIYFPKQTRHMNLDGCYFGTTFPHLFLHMYGDQQPTLPSEDYTPRIYGFKLHKTFRSNAHYKK